MANGRDITVIAEKLQERSDSVLDDEPEFVIVALQTSGIEAALPDPEIMAADGGD